MQLSNIKYLFLVLLTIGCLVSCDDDDMTNEPDFSATYTQKDQMARPAINTVFVNSGSKDNFNTTIPSNMAAAYASAFQAKLAALNPGYTTNALGQDAATFTGLLAQDVLNVNTSGITTFFNGTQVLTGRALSDDVIDVELLLIFGGPTGTSNPQLTSDNVSANDKAFLPAFPYLASPW